MDLSQMTLPSAVEGPEVGVSRRSMYRRHSDEYKRRIVTEYESLPAGGTERGSMLRREGLARTQVYEWRKTYAMVEPKKRRTKRNAEQVEIDRLRAKNARLEAELERTKLALEITGKAHALLEMFAESADSETEPSK